MAASAGRAPPVVRPFSASATPRTRRTIVPAVRREERCWPTDRSRGCSRTTGRATSRSWRECDLLASLGGARDRPTLAPDETPPPGHALESPLRGGDGRLRGAAQLPECRSILGHELRLRREQL